MQSFVKRYDVVSFGHALVDVQADVSEDFLVRHKMNKNDMTLVSPAQAAWLYNQMPPATECSGGSGANSMAIVAALGGRSGFMGRVGSDSFGDIFVHDLKKSGVVYQPRQRDPDPTGRCLVLITPDHKRTMNTSLGCSDKADHSDLDHDLIAKARILLVEGYMFDSPATRAATEAAIDVAKRSNTKVAFTLSSESCIERHRSRFLDLMADQADIVLANDGEIKAVYQTGNLAMARLQAKQNCRVVVVTKGSDGAELLRGGQTVGVPAVPGVKVVDTTGAGDAFAGGLLYGLAQDMSPSRSMRIGALCAAEVISHRGARPVANLKEFVAFGLRRNLRGPKNSADGPA